MSITYDVAVVGATGLVGETVLSILEQRNFPIGTIYLLASERSVGKKIQFQGKSVSVENLQDFDFSQTQIAWFCAGGSTSEKYAPIAADSGCIVIDNSSFFRNDFDVPLVIPEVNPDSIINYSARNIIANPNCSTIQMLLALAPIHREVGIERINVCTYQAVSGSGKAGLEELAKQTTSLLNAREVEVNVYSQQIAFNVLPHIDVFQDNGYTREEMKMVWETHKILEDESIVVNPTCVRVPVFHAHSEAVHIDTAGYISADEVRTLLAGAEGVEVIDSPQTQEYASAVVNGSGSDKVFVSRIREDLAGNNGINLWVVSDNGRKGAALNAVQIAELLIEKYL
ncbi:MAG: aspartate-semialdehyde dehydrogenase [Pseudomonadales bacterium]|nr:aspartate-semialdehyde dehydrogenase [Pseudomonadales bacterium]NRA17795.1 aspartate-semialdehyde dehydrogenase [Oceanospirillaceae bacterium]